MVSSHKTVIKSSLMVRLRALLAWIILVAIPLQGIAAGSMFFCGSGAHEGAAHHPVTSAVASDHHEHAAQPAHEHSSVDEASQELELDPRRGNVHKCSVCGVCSHAVGITGPSFDQAFASVPHAGPDAHTAVVHSRSTAVPDKPPRE